MKICLFGFFVLNGVEGKKKGWFFELVDLGFIFYLVIYSCLIEYKLYFLFEFVRMRGIMII